MDVSKSDPRGLRAVLAGLALAGFLISAYLTWTYLNGAAPACVGGSSGCETVQTGRYSEILSFPVAALGLFAYAALPAMRERGGGRVVVVGVEDTGGRRIHCSAPGVPRCARSSRSFPTSSPPKGSRPPRSG